MLGDSITTDHISPAGSIPASSPAGRYLIERDVEPRDFNSFGSRRGNHEVMMRGTFGNIRLRNLLAGGEEGNWTEHLPSGEITSIYEAAMRYQEEGTPLVVLAGSLYGNGSSRDWAAKGTLLLGVRAVIAKSFERIHRGNLVGMGVLPLQFLEGEGVEELGLTGRETFTIAGMADLQPRQQVEVAYVREDGSEGSFPPWPASTAPPSSPTCTRAASSRPCCDGSTGRTRGLERMTAALSRTAAGPGGRRRRAGGAARR